MWWRIMRKIPSCNWLSSFLNKTTTKPERPPCLLYFFQSDLELLWGFFWLSPGNQPATSFMGFISPRPLKPNTLTEGQTLEPISQRGGINSAPPADESLASSSRCCWRGGQLGGGGSCPADTSMEDCQEWPPHPMWLQKTRGRRPEHKSAVRSICSI